MREATQVRRAATVMVMREATQVRRAATVMREG